MAAVTLLGTVTFNTTAGSKTVTATPAVGDLIVIITAHSGNVSTTTPPTDNNSDGLGVYVLATSALKNASADVMCVWVRRNKIGSATSTVFTHTPGTTTGGGLGVMKVTGMSLVSLLAAIRSGASANQASGGTPSVSLGAAANTNNAIIGAVFSGTNSTTTVANNASYTEVFDNGYATPTSGLEIMTRNSGETGSSIAWGGTVASAFCAVAIELDVSVPAASSSLTDNFDDNSQAAAWGQGQLKSTSTVTTGVTVSEANQRLEVTPNSGSGTQAYSGYLSAGNYSLLNDSAFVKISHSAAIPTNQETFLGFGDSQNAYIAIINDTACFLQLVKAGVGFSNSSTFAYSSTTHAWLRMRYDGTSLYLDTATSSASDPPVSGDWTNRITLTPDAAVNLSGGKIALNSGTIASTTPATARFDGFNTATTAAVSASIAANETTDAASASTTVTTGATLAATDAADTTSIASAVTTGAALTATETKDAGSVSATVTTGATISATETTDSAAVTAANWATAQVAANEASDAAALATTVTAGATLAANDSSDTVSATGTATEPASVTATETSDGMSASATVTTGAAVSATDASDTASVTVANWSTAQLAAAEGSDTTAIAATVTAGATIAAAETGDTTSIAASAGSATTSATIAANETTDSGSVTATVATAAGLAASEASDAANVTADNWRTAQVSTTEGSDTAAFAAAATTGAALVSVEASDTVAADAQIWVTAQVAANDNADIGDGTAGPPAKTYPLAGIPQPYPGTPASYPLVDAQAYPLTQAQTYPLEGIPQQYPLAS